VIESISAAVSAKYNTQHGSHWPFWRTWRYTANMSVEPAEWSVSEARDRFSDAVNRAAFGGEITYVTRGRRHQRAAAIVPADLVARYEELVDHLDAQVAAERLADIDTGRVETVSADEVHRALSA